MDVDGGAGVADADLDALSGDADAATAADAALDDRRRGGNAGWWAGGAGVAGPHPGG
jgi:hypothetical protein